jgi:uncharacterized protein (TIGR00255 family)
MTGFGKAEGIFNQKKYLIEAKSVNGRFCEINFKYPKYLTSKDSDIKEIIRQKISRGKLIFVLTVDENNNSELNFILDNTKIKKIHSILKSLKKSIGSSEKIKLQHILSFSEIFTSEEALEISDEEYDFISDLLKKAVDDLFNMKTREGDFIKKDLMERIKIVEDVNEFIENQSKNNILQEKEILKNKIEMLLLDKSKIDENRLEFELALLAEKLDITEECIRLKSHIDYFISTVESAEYSGRRLNFLLQEMNREINTMASKSMDAIVSQKVSELKEELERIREQVQNIE